MRGHTASQVLFMSQPAVLSGTFTGTTQSDGIKLHGNFNIAVYGGTATVALQCSFDGGSTYINCSFDVVGTPATWAVTALSPIKLLGFEPEENVLYRLSCTAYSSPTSYRLSK